MAQKKKKAKKTEQQKNNSKFVEKNLTVNTQMAITWPTLDAFQLFDFLKYSLRFKIDSKSYAIHRQGKKDVVDVCQIYNCVLNVKSTTRTNKEIWSQLQRQSHP